MFFNFLEEVDSGSGKIPAIWEAETSIAAVLMEALGAKRSATIAYLKKESLFLLKHKGLPPDISTESSRNIQRMLETDSESFDKILRQLTDLNAKGDIRKVLSPDKAKILKMVRLNRGFASYLKGQKGKV